MKYGKKTFFTLVIVFLAFINAAGVLFVFMSAKNNENIQKETYKNEYVKIANTFEGNYEKLVEYDSQRLIDSLMKSMLEQYTKDNICVEFRNSEEMLLYSNFFEPQNDIKKNYVEIIRIDSRRHVIVSSMICAEKYQMVVGFDVEDTFKYMSLVNTAVMVVCILLSVIFIVLVYASLKRQSKLLEATLGDINKIAQGDFTDMPKPQKIKGYGDFESGFELMCQKINSSIDEAQKEARISRTLVDMTSNTLMPPLESIQRTAYDLLNYSQLSEKEQDQINYISREAARIGKNAGKILEICDVQRKTLEFADVELSTVFDSVAYSLSRKIKDIGVRYEVIPTELKLVGDRELFSTLFYELSAVAVNSCRSGSKVTIGTEDNFVVIKNDNASISQDDVDKLNVIFECGEYDKNASLISHLRFELCKQILNVHNAKIRFEHNYGLVIYVAI